MALLRPEEQVLEAMPAGWEGQQAARGLSGETIGGRRGRVRAFTDHAGCPPWLWTPHLFEEWCADLRSVHHVAASTLRGQAGAVRLFCEYLTDPVYAWAEVCWGYFGTVQVCTRWNTPRHVQDGESGPERRAFTVTEPVGLDYSISLACGLGSSLGDLLGCLPARALPARLPDGAGSA